MAKKWTRAEEEFLATHYRDLTDEDLAERLGVTKRTVALKLRKLGLERAEETSDRVQDGDLTGKRTFIRGSDEEVAARRASAVQAFDAANQLIAQGRKANAITRLERMSAEFTDVVDVVHQARVLLDMLRNPDEYVASHEEGEEIVLPGDTEAACAKCGSTLMVSEETIRAWCDICEKYVGLASPQEIREGGQVEGKEVVSTKSEAPKKASERRKRSPKRKAAAGGKKTKRRTGSKKSARK